MGERSDAAVFGRNDDNPGDTDGLKQGRTPMRDPRRTRNIVTGLLLAAVAASFFAFIIVKYMVYGQ